MYYDNIEEMKKQDARREQSLNLLNNILIFFNQSIEINKNEIICNRIYNNIFLVIAAIAFAASIIIIQTSIPLYVSIPIILTIPCFIAIYLTSYHRYIVDLKDNQIIKQTTSFSNKNNKTELKFDQINTICVSTIVREHRSRRRGYREPRVTIHKTYELIVFNRQGKKIILANCGVLDKLNEAAKIISEAANCELILGNDSNRIDMVNGRIVKTNKDTQIKEQNSIGILNILIGFIVAIGLIISFFAFINFAN